MTKIEKDTAIEFVCDPKKSRQDKILAALYLLGNANTAEVRRSVVSLGIREAAKWNISAILAALELINFVSKHSDGWQVRSAGREQLLALGFIDDGIAKKKSRELRERLNKVAISTAHGAAVDSVTCIEALAFRAAVVMSWVGAIGLMQIYCLSKYPIEIDAAAKTRLSTPKKQHSGILKIEVFEEIKESAQLQLFQDIGIIGKTLKSGLLERLNLRNAAGHPNSVSILEITASAHVEYLFANVFEKFELS